MFGTDRNSRRWKGFLGWGGHHDTTVVFFFSSLFLCFLAHWYDNGCTRALYTPGPRAAF